MTRGIAVLRAHASSESDDDAERDRAPQSNRVCRRQDPRLMDRYGIGPQRLGLIAAPGGIHEHPSLDQNSLLAAEITGIFDAGDEREPPAPPF
jgi:hypothetical protein